MACTGSARAALLVVLAMLMTSALSDVSFAESFDKPIRQTIVDLGPTPYMPRSSGARIKLSCSYYPAFMVKQLDDEGQKGTQWVTIVPILEGNAPLCKRSHIHGERYLERDGWVFSGSKNQLLFLAAPDGINGGMPFRILNWKNGRTLFQDSVLFASGKADWAFTNTPSGIMSLSYLRLVAGDCSIAKEGASCWVKFRQKFGLPLTEVPTCTGYRNDTEKKWTVGDPGGPPGEIDTPSAIAYPVVVDLLPIPSTKAVPGPIKCTPIE
jgi:hypothetical protein